MSRTTRTWRSTASPVHPTFPLVHHTDYFVHSTSKVPDCHGQLQVPPQHCIKTPLLSRRLQDERMTITKSMVATRSQALSYPRFPLVHLCQTPIKTPSQRRFLHRYFLTSSAGGKKSKKGAAVVGLCFVLGLLFCLPRPPPSRGVSYDHLTMIRLVQ